MTDADLSFLLSQCVNPSVVIDSDLMVVGQTADAHTLEFKQGASILGNLDADPEKRITVKQCFTSTIKRRFQLMLNEGFDAEVIGWRLAGPFRADKLVMLQFIDLAQARAGFVASTSQVRSQKKTRALSSKNKTLEARIAERTAQLVELNENLEQKVVERTCELTRSHEEMEQLTYIVTHDLKVPITNLTHLVQILKTDFCELPPETNEIVSMMVSSCTQANEKLEALLCVAQARSADLSVPEMIDLGAAVNTSCDLLRHEVERRAAVITHDFSAVDQIHYPAAETASLFENLIGNAIKYAHPERTPEIHVRSWIEPEYTCVSFQDNGTGLVLPRDEEKVFGLFKRAHVDPPGNGIALHSIRKILERHGGVVALESVIGEWTKFIFKFPQNISP